MNWIKRSTVKLAAAGALFSLLVFAADIPEALPAGFLEQLPALMQMRDEEYEALLRFIQQEPVPGTELSDAPTAQETTPDDN